MITRCDSVSDTFDRTSWYANRIVERERKRDWNREFEISQASLGRVRGTDWDCYVNLTGFYKKNITESPKTVFTCWEFFGLLWFSCQWMNITSETRAKLSFYETKTKNRDMYYKEMLWEHYVINYYYCYDYYLQWLPHHYRIIRRLN